MEIENLSEKVRQAKEAVESLEEPLKTEAFKKILDKLLEPDISPQIPTTYHHPQDTVPLNNSISRPKKVTSTKKKKINNILNKSNAEIKEESEKKKRELAQKLNRTKYADIYKLKNILSKSLYILEIMKKEGIKDLTPPEIQFILREVFSIKQSAESISVALNRKEAMKYTNRNRIIIGRTIAYRYELMREGEIYLHQRIEDETKNKRDNHVNKTDEGEEPDLS